MLPIWIESIAINIRIRISALVIWMPCRGAGRSKLDFCDDLLPGSIVFLRIRQSGARMLRGGTQRREHNIVGQGI